LPTPLDPPYAADIDQEQQADYIVRAYQWGRKWGHVDVMVLGNLDFWPVAGPEPRLSKYGIVDGDWRPRPAYEAIKEMPK
jgi:hypothetical protein